MQAGLVTTVIPVFGRAEMLLEAIGSVLAQTYAPLEIVVVDDGSPEPVAIRDPRVTVIRHDRNRGVGMARETGRLAARGEFIQYLDSDDVLLPRKFELQVAGLRANPRCGASYGWTRVRHGATVDPRPAKRTGEEIETLFPAMLESRWWHTPTPLWRRSLVDAAGPWLDLNTEEDWEYDARIAAEGVRLHFVPEWVCEVRFHDEARLSRRGRTPEVLRDRAIAHARILEHARRAGIDESAPEMRHFARELFLLSRQCGAAGLPRESHMLFDLAREASGEGGSRMQFRLYRAAAALVGWSNAGRLAALMDRLRW